MKIKTSAVLFAVFMGLFLSACQAPPEGETSAVPSTSQSVTEEGETSLPEVPEGVEDLTRRTISTVEELLAFSRWTNETPLEEQEGITWTLTADLDLSGVEWVPAGQGSYDPGLAAWTGGFAGIFEGEGHTISGIRVVGTNPDNTGGFIEALARGAVVRNLHATGEVLGENCVGGLIGGGNATSPRWDDIRQPALVEGCSFTGTVRGTKEGVGGLMGNSGEETILRRCQAIGEVHGAYTLGGFVGSLSNNAAAEDCCFSGTVISDLPAKNAESFGLPLTGEQPEYGPNEIQISAVGGFIGGNYGSHITNCWSDADLVTNAPCSMTGIFIGYHSGADPNCRYNQDKAGLWTPGYAYPGSNSFFESKGLRGEEIKDTASYPGWDFETVWEMGETGPRLRR